MSKDSGFIGALQTITEAFADQLSKITANIVIGNREAEVAAALELAKLEAAKKRNGQGGFGVS